MNTQNRIASTLSRTLQSKIGHLYAVHGVYDLRLSDRRLWRRMWWWWYCRGGIYFFPKLSDPSNRLKFQNFSRLIGDALFSN